MILLMVGLGIASSPAMASTVRQDSQYYTLYLDVFERSWIEVEVNGTAEFRGIMPSGTSQEWSGKDIYLKIGNAGGARVTVNGQYLGVLGAPAEVVTRHWQNQPQPDTNRASIFPLPVTSTTASPNSSSANRKDSLIERMTLTARYAASNSAYHKRTWVSYYGRPKIAVMGILGEYSIDELVPLLRKQADAYDEANGPRLGVMPAFHLVYGMATKAPNQDNSYLAFLSDDVVMDYVERAAEEGFAVILDIQIGALSPLEAMQYGFPWLKYQHVHLALDPEFAMSHPNQKRPGNPIGFVTAQQVNEVQAGMREYMKQNKLTGRRVLILHQFLDAMILNKEQLERVYKVDLTLTADGWGNPWAKITKYNALMSPEFKFTGVKLFYRWDEPLLTERQVLGLDQYPKLEEIKMTPNLIIYQ
jgi:hypothetical protein